MKRFIENRWVHFAGAFTGTQIVESGLGILVGVIVMLVASAAVEIWQHKRAPYYAGKELDTYLDLFMDVLGISIGVAL